MTPKQQQLLENKVRKIVKNVMNEATNYDDPTTQIDFWLKTINESTKALMSTNKQGNLPKGLVFSQMQKIIDAANSITKIAKKLKQ